jgi:hypothetical protein
LKERERIEEYFTSPRKQPFKSASDSPSSSQIRHHVLSNSKFKIQNEEIQ